MLSNKSTAKPKNLKEFIPQVTNKLLESKQSEAKAKHQEIQKAFVMFKQPQNNISS